jgi:hypothetical protein
VVPLETDRGANALVPQTSKRRRRVRTGIERPISLEQIISGILIGAMQGERIVKGVGRTRPKISMNPAKASDPRIFELF